MSERLRKSKTPTPRDRILPDRFNVKLSFHAKVLENSYLFTGAFVKEVKVNRNFLNKLNYLTKRYLKGEINEHNFINMVNTSLSNIIKLKSSNEIPKIKGRVIIPGSSVKGVVRSRIEYKLSPKYSCYSVESRSLPQEKFLRKHVILWGEEVTKARGSCRAETGEVCLICDLFGTAGLSSRVHFSDMIMTDGSTQYLEDLGIEAVAPSSKFNLEVICSNADFLDLGLIFLGLEVFTNTPILMCAYKYRFNPKLSGKPYRGRYVFGLVKFNLDSFSEIFTDKLKDLTIDDLKSRAKVSIESLGGDVMMDRGVLNELDD